MHPALVQRRERVCATQVACTSSTAGSRSDKIRSAENTWTRWRPERLCRSVEATCYTCRISVTQSHQHSTCTQNTAVQLVFLSGLRNTRGYEKGRLRSSWHSAVQLRSHRTCSLIISLTETQVKRLHQTPLRSGEKSWNSLLHFWEATSETLQNRPDTGIARKCRSAIY